MVESSLCADDPEPRSNKIRVKTRRIGIGGDVHQIAPRARLAARQMHQRRVPDNAKLALVYVSIRGIFGKMRMTCRAESLVRWGLPGLAEAPVNSVTLQLTRALWQTGSSLPARSMAIAGCNAARHGNNRIPRPARAGARGTFGSDRADSRQSQVNLPLEATTIARPASLLLLVGTR